MTLIALCVPLLSAEPSIPPLGLVREALRDRGSAGALTLILEGREPREAAGAALRLSGALFTEDRDLAASALLTLAAVPWCLGLAETTGDDDLAGDLRSAAMALAFNLAANAWPGWGDEGIEIGATDLALGLDMARLNLRLAAELEKGPSAEATGHWIVGAQLLAAGRHQDALAAFGAARAGYDEAGDAAGAAMATGYAALTELLSGDGGSEDALKRALEALRALPGEDAPFYADQIERAREVFVAR